MLEIESILFGLLHEIEGTFFIRYTLDETPTVIHYYTSIKNTNLIQIIHVILFYGKISHKLLLSILDSDTIANRSS